MTDPKNSFTPAPRHVVTVFLTTGVEMRPFGRTRDLSVSGAFVETSVRPEVGTDHEIAMVWGEDTFVCLARVVRHTEDGIGLNFLNADDTFRIAVEDIIRNQPVKPKTPNP